MKNTIQGEVTEALPNTTFRVKTEDGRELICYLAGKMRFKQISVHVGDTVEVIPDPAGGKVTNRIVWRK